MPASVRYPCFESATANGLGFGGWWRGPEQTDGYGRDAEATAATAEVRVG